MPQGNLTSMNYPNNYEKSTTCEWLLRTEPSHSMSFKFTDFDLESSTNCTADAVRIYDGSKIDANKLMFEACGSQMPNETLRSMSNEMLVVMESNDNFEAKGFSARYGVVNLIRNNQFSKKCFSFIYSILY